MNEGKLGFIINTCSTWKAMQLAITAQWRKSYHLSGGIDRLVGATAHRFDKFSVDEALVGARDETAICLNVGLGREKQEERRDRRKGGEI